MKTLASGMTMDERVAYDAAHYMSVAELNLALGTAMQPLPPGIPMGTVSDDGTLATFVVYVDGRRINGIVYGRLATLLDAAARSGRRVVVHELDGKGFGPEHVIAAK